MDTVMHRENQMSRVVLDGRRADDGTRCIVVVGESAEADIDRWIRAMVPLSTRTTSRLFRENHVKRILSKERSGLVTRKSCT